MKYVTIIDDQSYEIEIDNDGAILVNGELRDVDFLNLGGSLYSIITENKSLEAVIDDDEGKIAVMMGGQLFETQVLDERAMLLVQRRGGLKITSGEVLAPMPGLIVIVTVEVGQTLAQGDTVVILESMKMQNELKTPVAGVVTAIHVEASQAVDKGDILVEIGPSSEDDQA
ncbi:MAG: acetyl-CoA carboxylase biotin carboxyl carrier protein subunit [Chloroflexi bacterium]|nr:acetyl-CoA carboxylase biotin carboxyl carrier protein subunit [Chloroflexota bacterium]